MENKIKIPIPLTVKQLSNKSTNDLENYYKIK